MALSKIQTSEMLDTPNLGRRNLIINGALQVAQRGTTVSTLASSGYQIGPDRFRRSMNNSGGHQVTRERLSNDAAEGFVYSLKETVTTVSSASDTTWAWRPFNYRIEGQDLQHLKFGTSNAESVTLSFYVKSNKTGTASVVIYSYDSGGSYRTNTRRFTINAANTWEKKTLTFNGDTTTAIRNTNEIGFDMMIYAQSGSARTVNDNTSWGVGETNSAWYQCDLSLNTLNDFIMLTGFQLEVGDKATDFEHRSFAEELKLCQRYFITTDTDKLGDTAAQSSYIMGTGYNSRVRFTYYHPTPMRTKPAGTVVDASGNGNITYWRSASSYSYSGTWSFENTMTSSSYYTDGTLSSVNGQAVMAFMGDSSSNHNHYLELNAEL